MFVAVFYFVYFIFGHVQQPFPLFLSCFVFVFSSHGPCDQTQMPVSAWPDSAVNSGEQNSQVTLLPCRLKDCVTLFICLTRPCTLFIFYTEMNKRGLLSDTERSQASAEVSMSQEERVNCKSSPPGWALHSAGGQ